MNRREVIIGIGLAGATAAAPIAGATLAKAADRSEWNKAVARLKAVKAEYERVSAHSSATHDVAEASCPYRREFFSRYGLGATWDRERNVRAAQRNIMIERAKGQRLTADEAKQATADAYHVVDDFEGWCARRDEAFREHHAWEERFDALADKRLSAQEAVLSIEAPDHEALLFKIELLAGMLNEAAVEDADRLNMIRTDARRLLPAGRA
jgi:hypothetical protein